MLGYRGVPGDGGTLFGGGLCFPDLVAEGGLEGEHGGAVVGGGVVGAGLLEEECGGWVVDEVVAEVLWRPEVGTVPGGGVDIGVHAYRGGVDEEVVGREESLGFAITDDGIDSIFPHKGMRVGSTFPHKGMPAGSIFPHKGVRVGSIFPLGVTRHEYCGYSQLVQGIGDGTGGAAGAQDEGAGVARL